MITRLEGQAAPVELRAFALTDMVSWGYDRLRNITPSTSVNTVRGIPAIHRAAKIRSEALACLRLRCWRGEYPMRERVDSTWQARLFAARPNYYQSRFDFWETVGESLAYRNNAYIWKNVDPLTAQIVDWWALHPDQVACKGAGDYEVDVKDGYLDPVGRGKGRYRVGQDTILHVRGHGDGGTFEAPSPIQVFREALSSPIERQRYESNMWRKGGKLSLAVQFPQGVSKEQADEFRQMWRETYEGSGGETTAIVGGGADIKPISMTAKDAEYVQLAHLTVEDAARIMGVPAELLELRIDQAPPSLEEVTARWYRFGFGPTVERIESALADDRELFGIARTYPGFEASDYITADLATEDTIAHQQVQDGRLLVDEWRAQKGLPPLPNGAGKVPQVVPVGGGPNPSQSNGEAPQAEAA